MRAASGVADRFLDLVDRRVAPALETLGFERTRTGLVWDGGDLQWLAEIELAPWTAPDRICFTLAWGVAVPGLAEVLGDRTDPPARAATSLVSGRLGERAPGVEVTWFTVGRLVPVPGMDRVVDARTGATVAAYINAELLPALQPFDSVAAVQAHLVDGLVRGRGSASESELRLIRWIAGLSLLLDERDNAARWLDYLEARSASSMAPHVVAERLAPLREQCLAS